MIKQFRAASIAALTAAVSLAGCQSTGSDSAPAAGLQASAAEPDCLDPEVAKAKAAQPGVTEAVGGTVAATAGQVAGAAVAGPIGAALGGVVGGVLGRNAAKVVKSKPRACAPTAMAGQPDPEATAAAAAEPAATTPTASPAPLTPTAPPAATVAPAPGEAGPATPAPVPAPTPNPTPTPGR